MWSARLLLLYSATYTVSGVHVLPFTTVTKAATIYVAGATATTDWKVVLHSHAVVDEDTVPRR